MAWASSPAEPAGPLPLEAPACALCGSDDRCTLAAAEEIERQARFLCEFHEERLLPGSPPDRFADRCDFSQSYQAAVVECARCGLIYRCPRPAAWRVVAGYAAGRYSRARLDSLFTSARPLFARKVNALRRILPAGARVLEVGSYTGAFLDAARDAGWRAIGVDVGEDVVTYARSRGLQVLQGQLPGLALPLASFDALFVWNCLDQVPEPRPLLEAAKALLRAGGLLAARVPNGECFRAAMRLPAALRRHLVGILAWNNLLSFPYLYGYTAAALRRLLGESGFRVERVAGDVMVSLADPDTCPWAAREEARAKRRAALLSRLAAWASAGRVQVAPWIEVMCRKPG